MINWLYNLIFGQQYAVISSIRTLLWDTLKGLTSWVQKIFQNTSDRWQDIYMQSYQLQTGTNGFGQQVYWRFWRLYKQDIPYIRKVASDRSTRIEQWSQRNFTYVMKRIGQTHDQAWAWIVALTFMVVHVIVPLLMRLITTLATQMRDWAFVAWDLVTHPPKLAGILFWPLFAVFQLNPFTIGRTIGDWALKLVLHEFVRSSQLVEQVVTDIL